MDAYNISLVLMYIGMLLVFLITTIALKSKGDDWSKFWTIFFFSTIIGGIILAWLIMSPEQISSWASNLNGTIIKN